jgi:glycosyltransferase involved in cell wall biosynthesis
LVEAMGFGNCVLVNDTLSNLEVIGDAGFRYRGCDGERDLFLQLEYLLQNPDKVSDFRLRAAERARSTYNWEEVVEAHSRLYRQRGSDAHSALPEGVKSAETKVD